MAEQGFRWDAADYARHSSAQAEWARELIAKLNLQGTESLLDIGCGDGRITALLAGLLPRGQATGIDLSGDMIERARRTFPQAEHPNLCFLRMDALRLDFAGEFDVVFSNAALHWIREQQALLARVETSLKKGGWVLFQMAGQGNAAGVLTVLDQMLDCQPWKPWFQDFAFPYAFCGVEEYRTWLRQAGLQDRRIELIPKDMQQQGREGLAGWIRTTWLPYLERVPADRREEFVAALVDRYLEQRPADPDGVIHVDMVRLEVEAIKP